VTLQRRVYNKPPVQEIVCDFRFKSAPVPLVAIAQLLDVFEDYPSIIENFDLKLKSPKWDGNSFSIHESLHRVVRMTHQEETSMVQFGEGMLAFNQIGAHHGWEHFRENLLQVYSSYRQIVQPESLQQITLRYLDRIDIPGEQINAQDYFRIVPPQPEGMGTASFFSQTMEIPCHDKETLRINISRLKSEDPEIGLSVMMDLHFFVLHGLATDEDLLNALERAHCAISDHFELSITDETRKLFDEATV
jgi:uncharacterized protein (TIGR04255 family)